MHNEEKVEAAKKDAGGDEKLIIKFAWPKIKGWSSFFVILGEDNVCRWCLLSPENTTVKSFEDWT